MNKTINIHSHFQKFPSSGKLKENMNKRFSELKEEIKDDSGFVEAYKIDSVMVSSDKKNFVQTGCGPNYEGGLLSQCMCRQDIRQKHSCDEWENNWMAGITSLRSVYGKKKDTYLFYLMKVDKAFCTFKQLWDYYNEVNPSLIEAKQTTANVLGDLYIPINADIDDERKTTNYLDSIDDHPHFKYKSRLKDINYPEWRKQKALKKAKKNRRVTHAKLLLGDVERSYLWNKPDVHAIGWHSKRGQKYSINEFLNILEDTYCNRI